jgi:hypothetical protein
VTTPGSSEMPDPSPSAPARLRESIVAELHTMGWSVSAAADTGLSTTVMLNEAMIGASVDMTAMFQAETFQAETTSGRSAAVAQPRLKVFAFSVTTENPITIATGTVVKSGSPSVTIEHHEALDLTGCSAEVDTSGDLEQVTANTIAALAATVEQFRLLTA